MGLKSDRKQVECEQRQRQLSKAKEEKQTVWKSAKKATSETGQKVEDEFTVLGDRGGHY